MAGVALAVVAFLAGASLAEAFFAGAGAFLAGALLAVGFFAGAFFAVLAVVAFFDAVAAEALVLTGMATEIPSELRWASSALR